MDMCWGKKNPHNSQGHTVSKNTKTVQAFCSNILHTVGELRILICNVWLVWRSASVHFSVPLVPWGEDWEVLPVNQSGRPKNVALLWTLTTSDAGTEMTAYLMCVRWFRMAFLSAILPGTPTEREESSLSAVTLNQRWSSQSSAALLSYEIDREFLKKKVICLGANTPSVITAALQ